ncbi:MAG: glycosyltransferase [Aquabacterium sp.]|nr:glycosyltransferase [Aquabacterium sp.]
MIPALSVTIPAHNEARYIGRCIESVWASAHHAGLNVEVVVALNRCTDATQALAESLGARCVVEDRKCIAAVRNAAIRASTAQAIATIDADSWMTTHSVASVLSHAHNPRFIGGGAFMLPERWSAGILATGLLIAPLVMGRGVSGGMFWFLRDTFEALNGFDERLVSIEDLDFALRMKALGQARGRKFGTVWRGGIKTSCRKFDTHGDWHLVINPGLLRRIFSGRDRAAADQYYYDVDR